MSEAPTTAPTEAAVEPAVYDPPPGYETVEAYLEAARKTFQADVDSDRLNRDAALEDAKFAAGEQWDVQDVAARKGRPCLTINTLPQYVAQVVGDIRINKPSIRVRPAEDSDKPEAEVREGLIRQIERASKAQNVYADAGQAQTIGGLGNFRVDLEYAADDAFDRDIRINRIPNPAAVVWDRMSVDPTGRDAGHCFVIDEIAREEFEKRYPNAKASSLTVPLAEQSGWVTRDIVRITEHWMVVEKPVTIALLPGGKIVDADKVPEGVVPLKTRETVRKSVCMYLINGFDILAEPVEWPINRVPVFKVTGWEIWVGSRRDRFGLVRFAKDPIRYKNYFRSVSAETLALAPRAQWLVGVSENNPQQDFRDAASSGDTVLPYTGQTPPQRIDPPPIPAAVLNEANIANQDIKDVTGLHDASLGMRSNETSGKAIVARERQGDVATYIYGDNLRAAVLECGDVVNQLIPVVYDTARTLVVLGEDEVAKAVRVNDPSVEGAIDFGSGKYDIVIDTGPSYSTKRVEAAESMMQFVQALPQTAAVAADLIAQAQDWPNADAFAERLRRAMPPQITQDKDAAPSPEAQQAMAAAQRKAEFDLAEAQAKARKAEAEATEAEAKAAIALADASQRGVNLSDTAPLTMPAAGGQIPPPPPPAAVAAPDEPPPV